MGMTKCDFKPCSKSTDKIVRVIVDNEMMFVCPRCAELIKNQKLDMIKNDIRVNRRKR